MAGKTVPFPSGLDMLRTEIKHARMQNLATDPDTPVEGQIYYNTASDMMRFYDGASWIPMSGINFKRAYSATTDYVRNDAVTYSGSTYVMYADAPAGTLPTDTDYWALLAEGGMAATYTNATPMPVAIGGYAAGTTFNARDNQNMWTGLLYPYQNPAFSNFKMTSGGADQATAVEVGTTVSGSKVFTFNVSNMANVKTGSITLYQGTASGTVLATGLSPTGNGNNQSITATINTVVNNTPASQVWTLKGTNTNNVDFTTTFTVAWQYKKFYGNSSALTLDGAGIQALANNSLGVSAAGNYTFPANEYKYIAIPVAWTAPSAIKDQETLLAVAMEDKAPYTGGTAPLNFATVSVTNANNITTNYRVYRSQNKLNTVKTFVVS